MASRQPKWRNAVFVLLALAVVLADQASKSYIRANLDLGQSLFDIGFFRIVNVGNSGAAFGLFQGQSTLLTAIAVIGILAVVLCVFLAQHSLHFLDNMLVKSALGLVLGGTLGNLIDRLRFGYITDFLDFKVWPSFNVADSAITIGVIIFAFTLFTLPQQARG